MISINIDKDISITSFIKVRYFPVHF